MVLSCLQLLTGIRALLRINIIKFRGQFYTALAIVLSRQTDRRTDRVLGVIKRICPKNNLIIKFSQFPGSLKAYIQNETAYKFDKFSLACEISGKNSDGTENKLTVKWKRNGTNLLETVTINREAEFKPTAARLYINQRNGNLIFNKTRIEDAGFYECHVNNGEELVISNKAELKLICKFKILLESFFFLKKLIIFFSS